MYIRLHDYIAQLISHGIIRQTRYPNAVVRDAFGEGRAKEDPLRDAANVAAANYWHHAQEQLGELNRDLGQLGSLLHEDAVHRAAEWRVGQEPHRSADLVGEQGARVDRTQAHSPWQYASLYLPFHLLPLLLVIYFFKFHIREEVIGVCTKSNIDR
ncbi:hypothetical protein PG985_007459 [Apiospora marii]|uniref:Uncharacterized protein n=1 Tax=Apiospora marii TaxID=335849 RepID=A0ABR1SQU8_9PEZI